VAVGKPSMGLDGKRSGSVDKIIHDQIQWDLVLSASGPVQDMMSDHECSVVNGTTSAPKYQPPVEIVMIGAPSLPPVSVRVITNIKNENSLFDR
jgi:hypothetical protein